MSNLPQIWAHRGDKAHAPENTLSAFDQAWKKGAHGIELDVWRCASGEVVVIHDRNPEALTGTSGDITAMSLSELRSLKLPQGERIPTLEEVLDQSPDGSWINVEIKSEGLGSQGVEAEVIRLLEAKKKLGQTVVSSFNPLTLYRLNRLAPKLRLGLLFHEDSAWPLRRAWAARFLKLYSLHPQFSLANLQMMRRAKKKGQKVIVWTINNIHDLETCPQAGVHAIITDDPAWLIETLERRSPHAPVVG